MVYALSIESTRLHTDVDEVRGIPLITVSGEIDSYTAPSFESAVNHTVNSYHGDLIIDLAQVGYMDSSGFGALLGATRRTREAGSRVKLIGCSEAIGRMMSITRLDAIFDLFPNLDEAVL